MFHLKPIGRVYPLLALVTGRSLVYLHFVQFLRLWNLDALIINKYDVYTIAPHCKKIVDGVNPVTDAANDNVGMIDMVDDVTLSRQYRPPPTSFTAMQ